jgi:hypothetical protein
MKQAVSTDLNSANIARVTTLLAETPSQLERLSQPLSLEILQQPLGAGERSFTETLAHLVNCEARTTEAIYLALLANEPLVADIHPERQFGKLVRYDRLACPELLRYFALRRTVLLGVLQPLPEAHWSRSIREEGKQRKEAVYRLARSLALHEREHLLELERKLAKEP